jgi:predicted translin family RNA/ssDNA-binding protein
MKSSVFSAIGKAYRDREAAFRRVSGLANDALRLSKRAIFAMHRDDLKDAKRLLAEASAQFKAAEGVIRTFHGLEEEGVYHAALEEYAEAMLFLQYLEQGKFGKLETRAMAPSVYLGGLSDATGELVRHAVRRATEGDRGEVERAYEASASVVAFLLDLDLTGNLRTKFDQAKKNLRTLEQMRYELSLQSR